MRFRILFLLPVVLVGGSYAQSTSFPVGPQYLPTTQSTEFLRPIATPSLSLEASLPPIPSLPQIGPVVGDQPYIPNPILEGQANLFPVYYGYPEIPAVILVSAGPTPELPASLNESGFVNVPTEQWLREHGYGVTLAEAAVFSNAHRRTAPRVYTNEDVQRLHGLGGE
jgi:hypothetical protein